MKKNQKILITFIILISIMILITISLLLVLKRENRKKENNISNQLINNIENSYIEEINDDVEITPNKIDNKIKYEDDRSTYFTIRALYNNYINWIGHQNKADLKNILSPQYISKYGITDNNIWDKLTVPKIDNDKQYYKTIIIEMLTAQIDDTTNVYIVKGKGRIVGKDTMFTVQAMFEVDAINNIYNVYPYQYLKDNGFDKLKVGDQISNYTKEEIIYRGNNKFIYTKKSDKEMANEYFNDYRELLQYYKDDAYSKLDVQYSKKRFGSKENFENYLEENRMTIALMSINKYKVESYQNYTDYICSDKYNNIYIFRQQNGIMNYTVFLDDYTIMTEEELNYYNKLEEFDKVKYNLNKFIKMVNTKDYDSIYNVLDNTFKNNNFGNIENLKKYLKTNMYNINDIEILDLDDETYEYYVFSCKITNKRNEKETKNMTIIINQGEGTDFTMSFSFN